jgi:hypothetical protein
MIRIEYPKLFAKNYSNLLIKCKRSSAGDMKINLIAAALAGASLVAAMSLALSWQLLLQDT